MRQKLQKFDEFVASLLPHEADYLLHIQQFQDQENLRILEQIRRNCEPGHSFEPFDPAVDKRKYSNLKKWIQTRLEAIDVDAQFARLHALDLLIAQDSIGPADEASLLAQLDETGPADFNFLKRYDTALRFRHFLIIRLRYAEHERVMQFLTRHEEAYRRARQTEERLYQAALDITRQYMQHDRESLAWENWLRSLVADDSLDGHNRYLAVVRLSLLYINYRRFGELREMYEELDRRFAAGESYSRRLLVNYYANRLILHGKFGEWEAAERYGRLSLREKNTEHLQYVNNLASVLDRQQKHREALALLQEAIPEMRQSQNFHPKAGFVALYMKSLLDEGQAARAEQYGDTFLRAHKAELLAQRWHLFFSIYFQCLLRQEKYAKIIAQYRSCQLAEREKAYRQWPIYLPNIAWMHLVALYHEGRINREKLRQAVAQDLEALSQAPHKRPAIAGLIEELYAHEPATFGPLRSAPPET